MRERERSDTRERKRECDREKTKRKAREEERDEGITIGRKRREEMCVYVCERE